MAGPRIVLVASKASANVGAAARAMKNFGLDELVLVAPRCELDRSAYALASHAGDVLDGARVVGTLDEALADRRLVLGTSARLRRAEGLPVRTPREAAPDLLADGVAVLFGPEDHGLDNDALNRCQGYLAIPTADYASLNLAQAVVVVAYEVHVARLGAARPARGERAAAGVPESGTRAPAEQPVEARVGPAPAPGAPGLGERAAREQMERFYAQLVDTFHLIGFTDELRERSVDRLFRGLFDRAALTPREVAALRGLLSQVQWAARTPPEGLPGRGEGGG